MIEISLFVSPSDEAMNKPDKILPILGQYMCLQLWKRQKQSNS